MNIFESIDITQVFVKLLKYTKCYVLVFDTFSYYCAILYIDPETGNLAVFNLMVFLMCRKKM